MKVSQRVWCFFGVHDQEVIAQYQVSSRIFGHVCGYIYATKCKCCGQISKKRVGP
jgi:hypothetical protein